MDKTPIYKESYEYAYQHGEGDQHIASNRANIACRDAIEKAIADHQGLNTFDSEDVDVRLMGEAMAERCGEN